MLTIRLKKRKAKFKNFLNLLFTTVIPTLFIHREKAKMAKDL